VYIPPQPPQGHDRPPQSSWPDKPKPTGGSTHDKPPQPSGHDKPPKITKVSKPDTPRYTPRVHDSPRIRTDNRVAISPAHSVKPVKTFSSPVSVARTPRVTVPRQSFGRQSFGLMGTVGNTSFGRMAAPRVSSGHMGASRMPSGRMGGFGRIMGFGR
jgi:hypothetical protein